METLEPARDLGPELVHRRVLAGRVEKQGELRGVAVEVRPEERPHSPDRAVSLRLVEQLADERPERAAIAEELLQRPGQPAVAVGEVRTKDLIQGFGGLGVGLLRGPQELLELVADEVDVDAQARVLERRQADPQGTLDEGRAILRLAIRDDRRKARVADDEARIVASIRPYGSLVET